MTAKKRVRIVAPWSAFAGCTGVVVATRPHLLVLVDGEREPMRFMTSEVE